MKKTMIFHIPWRIDPAYSSATSLRPFKMIQGFLDLGYRVISVMGTGAERSDSLLRIKKMLASGQRVDFLYSESSTQPTIIAGGKQDMVSYPFCDYRLFFLMKKYQIPIGLFYRDIYWRFSDLKGAKSKLRSNILFLLYWLDLLVYRNVLDAFFLPSYKMIPFLPISFKHVSELPPGTEERSLSGIKQETTKTLERLSILYVGGFGNHYKMHELLKAVTESPNVYLTLCTRKKEFENRKYEYQPFINHHRITIIHAPNHMLKEYYEKADICAFFLEPIPYREFAMPFKLFEYLSYGKPVIGVCGTACGDFIEKHNIGWQCAYSKDELSKLLKTIARNSKALSEKQHSVRKTARDHTWKARAETVAEMLLS